MKVLKIYNDDAGFGWEYCKPEWKNLVHFVSNQYPDWMKMSNTDTYILVDQELQKYNARLDSLDHYVKEIIFDNEESYTWFVMRYS